MDFTNKKILVIGDIILDTYIEGTVSRISPEAPIPILDKKRGYHRLGGATNVARNLSSLGAKVWIIGRIGNDKAGRIVKNLLDEANINVDLLLCDSNLPTTLKTRYLANNQQLLRVDLEDTTPVTYNPEFKECLMEDLERHFKYFDAIIVSDYNKGMITPTLLFEITELQEKYQKILTGDTKSKHWNLFQGFTCLTPNLKEYKDAQGVSSLENIKNNSRAVRGRFRLKQLLITLSEKGLLLVTENNTKHIPVKSQQFVDVTGAGDTVIAVYTLALTYGYGPEEAAELANIAASKVINKIGTATLKPEELTWE